MIVDECLTLSLLTLQHVARLRHTLQAERAHLDVYRVLGHVQNEMQTDDSFVFNKGKGASIQSKTRWSLHTFIHPQRFLPSVRSLMS